MKDVNKENNKKKMAVINGSHFSSLEGFYGEISLLFLKDQGWEVGTLDGFDDILYGFQGEIIWKNAQKSKQESGSDATKEFYENKISQGKPYNVQLITKKRDDLLRGNGQTLFEILVEIIESHKDINLVLN